MKKVSLILGIGLIIAVIIYLQLNIWKDIIKPLFEPMVNTIVVLGSALIACFLLSVFVLLGYLFYLKFVPFIHDTISKKWHLRKTRAITYISIILFGVLFIYYFPLHVQFVLILLTFLYIFWGSYFNDIKERKY